jgi:uncharacterized membrane protein
MSLWPLVFHAVNLLAPALALGVCMTVCELWHQRRRFSWGLIVRAGATYVLAGTGVLMVGVAVWGQDGKTATYAALVGVLGTLAAWRMPTQR